MNLEESITANSITLAPPTPTPTFCVGQQIAFGLIGTPPFANASVNWTLPSKYINETPPQGNASPIYDVNLNLQRYVTTSAINTTCWYVNGNGGSASVFVTYYFSNGQQVSVTSSGTFAIYRPDVYMISNDITEPRYFTITPGSLDGATVKLGDPGSGQGVAGQMVYAVRCDTDVDGLGEITQTCRLSFNPDPGGFNFSDWRCDGPENYVGPAAINASGTYVFYPVFDDGPQNGTRLSTSSIEVKGNFIDYVRFEPNTPGSIYVTLGIITWNLDGIIANGSTGWTFVTTNTPDPVGPNSSDQFPSYTRTR